MIEEIGVIVVAVQQHWLDTRADGSVDISFELVADH